VGDSVSQGQVVAWLAQPELLDRLQQARTLRDAAARELDQLRGFTRQDQLLERQVLERQRTNLRESVAASQASLRSLSERLRSQEDLVRQGLITRPTLLATQQQYDAMGEKLRNAQSELAQLDSRDLSASGRREEMLQAGRRKLEDSQGAIAQLEREFERASQVVSPYTGRVLEVMTEQGKLVGAGEPVLSLDLTGVAIKDLMAVMYLPSVHGKLVKPGMEILIAPSTVRQEEYGMMLGRVTFVSNFPATSRGMQRVLKNDKLVSELSGGGAPYEVHAELVVDPSTQSQYRWSSSGGPPIRIQSGTIATSMVMVSSQRPIAKVIPLFRKWTGT
jgi:HlyD family secretion protein